MCFITRKERIYFDQNSAKGEEQHAIRAGGGVTVKDSIKAGGSDMLVTNHNSQKKINDFSLFFAPFSP